MLEVTVGQQITTVPWDREGRIGGWGLGKNRFPVGMCTLHLEISPLHHLQSLPGPPPHKCQLV